MLTRREALASLLATGAMPTSFARAKDGDPTLILTDGKKPNDARLGPPITLNDSYFPFKVPATLEEWAARRKQVREQVLVANGLWPMPEKTPLNAVVHGLMERDGYTIEKVYFASMPGHYVTGNLYRPNEKSSGRRPGVLFAHGHWANGRFHDAGERAAKASVDAGGEADLDRGRFFMQAIPVTLARHGFTVFQYDMIGYADSTAITHREGFTDAQAELRSQSFMGLQTWNSIRALDFLLSLPDVDSTRIGMTGASGGGTQTFIMGAIDDRLTAAFPAVMVSTAMQGGCICENCSLLRLGTGNVELAGLFAPKPLAMSAANDWTKELMTKGYPELQKLYALHGKPENVAAKAWLEFTHQYNQKAREFMYAWFAKHLQGKDEQPKETAFKPVPPKELSVFDEKHPRPKDELGAAELRQKMTFASDDLLAKLTPNSPGRLKPFQEVVGTALRAMVNVEPMTTKESASIAAKKTEAMIGDIDVMKSIVAWPERQQEVPVLVVLPQEQAGLVKPKRAVLWLHPAGKSSLFSDGKPVPALKKLLDAQIAVAAPDLFGIGELTLQKPARVDEKYAGFTYGYNRSLLANRVFDALTVIQHATKDKNVPLDIVAWGSMGPIAVLVKALAGDRISKTAADLNGFRFEDIQRTDDAMMLPGALKYGGMGSFIALCAPGDLLIHNNKRTGVGKAAKTAYDAAGAPNKLVMHGEKLDDAKVVEWLLS